MKILTHDGEAHPDELLACGVIVVEQQGGIECIERRKPTRADMANNELIILDTGGEWNNQTWRLDHHHFVHGEKRATCALSLTLERYGLYASAKRALNWLFFVELADTYGAASVFKHLHITLPQGQQQRRVDIAHEHHRQLVGPLDVMALDDFSSHTKIIPSSDIWPLLIWAGNAIMRPVKQYESIYRAARQGAVELMIHERCHAVVIEPPATTLSAAFEVAGDIATVKGIEVAVIVLHDNHGHGWTMFKRPSAGNIDFTRLHGMAGVTYINKQADMLRTAMLLDIKGLRELLQAAYCCKESV